MLFQAHISPVLRFVFIFDLFTDSASCVICFMTQDIGGLTELRWQSGNVKIQR
jgi:hypothetical protein